MTSSYAGEPPQGDRCHVASVPLSSSTYNIGGGIDAPAVARREILRCYDWPSQRLRDEAALMLAELVTNAVLHGRVPADEEVRVDVEVGDHTMTFSVFDRGPGFVPRAPDATAPAGGFGLIIVDRLAKRWGVTHDPAGTRVWFAMALG
jgi:anti-sigma regulatory factor (Ser/Thr protein kinase)